MKIKIDSIIAPKLAEWFRAGRGVKAWTNLEIASGAAQEVFTPADASAPGWRYGNPVDLQPEDIIVRVFTPLESFRGRFKAMYWGPWVGKATEAKAKRLCIKHGMQLPGESFTVTESDVANGNNVHPDTGERLQAGTYSKVPTSWQWQHDDLPGYVQVTIGRTVEQPWSEFMTGKVLHSEVKEHLLGVQPTEGSAQ